MTAPTLPELLAVAAARRQGGWYFHSRRDVVALPVEELHERALRRAAELAAVGLGRGTSVGLVGQNRPEWAEWAWAIWIAGATLVPLPAPVFVPTSFGQQIAALVTASRCAAVVGERKYLDLLGGGDVARWEWSGRPPDDLTVRSAAAGPSTGAAEEDGRIAGGRAVAPSDVAVVLFTSGTTAAPKGVRLTHARAVEWARHNALAPRADGIPAMVTWFPFHHIAGLGVLFEIVAPVDQHIVDMRRFLAGPAAWLRLASETRASYAVSPSSVWSEVLEAVARDPRGIDLGHFDQVAFNAELADPDVVARLRETGGPLGLRPGAVAVHYASSEAGMISETTPGIDPRVDTVDLAELAGTGRAVPGHPGRPVKTVVSCGFPYPGVELCVGAPGLPLPERQVGEIWVRGPGVTDGYINVPDGGGLVDGWLPVGDLGYMAEGELFVTGRSDDIIVCFGTKHHPEDIERAVLRVTGLGPRSCAAFSPQGGAQGELVVVVETDAPNGDLPRAARAAVADAVGITPATVIVVPPDTIPTTPNGKLQRSRLRQMHARGELAKWEPSALS